MKNRRSFETMILPHGESLFGPAMALTRSAAEAEDLVQETLVRAFTRFDTYRADGSPRAWLHTIMRNLFYNAHRKKSREPQQVSLDQFASGTLPVRDTQPDASPERTVLSRIESDVVLRAVRSLPEEYRQVVALADVEGLPYQEIAERLNIPVGTVRSRLFRGRERVRRALSAWRPTDEKAHHSLALAA